ncbi:type I 3-dehydroquinate dehydratase [Pyrococcus sp. ST04]|uniref:type I 3-dehydroquinate dehydratase n=1 Tax=Pyrococcus sp. ST04 TaxID=1183377 RepID=UPI0002605E7B|nr:type I 3-dehydroquinate dehydratase [Pyrococcus sp. ST04]AFK23196.1 putative 3-dehydroquinate dehydratase [Pyrococcus sp. ST04]
MIAGVVLARTIKEAVRIMNSTDADLYELRVDYLENTSDIDLLEPFSNKLIITVRSKEEGGFKELSDDERISLFESFLKISPAYIDIEFRSRIRYEAIRLAEEAGSKIILSYHDLLGTPDFESLLSLLHSIEDEDPDVVKIVTYARDKEDNLRIIKLYEHANNLIAFCMGPVGKISRVVSLFYAPFTYASIFEEAAPGQLSVEEMRELMKLLGEWE